MSEFEKAVKIKVDNMVKDMQRRLEEISGVSSLQRGNPYRSWTVDDWLKVKDDILHEGHIRDYPNAKKAAELKKTKLYKALK